MIDLYLSLTPVFLFFFLGMLLRRLGVLDAPKAGVLLHLVFFTTLPAMLLVKVAPMELSRDDLLLPLIPILVVILNIPLALWLFKRRIPDPKTLGSLILCSIAINNALMIPFVYWGFGEEALVYVLIYDIGVALVQSSLVYGLAFKLSDQPIGARAIARKVATSPPLWAVSLALLLSLTATPIPAPLTSFLTPLGEMTGPLLLIALGAMFSLRAIKPGRLAGVMFLRAGMGAALGFGLATLFGLEGVILLVAILSSAAPIGFNVTTFAMMAKLDFDTAAGMASMSLLLALIYVPLLMALLSAWIPISG